MKFSNVTLREKYIK